MYDIRKAKVEGRMVSVIGMDTFHTVPDDCKENLAIEHNGLLYPVKNKNGSGPGMYPGPLLCKFVHPESSQIQQYSAEENSINFNDIKNIQDLISKQDKLKKMEQITLTTDIGDIFKPPILETDSVETAALKEAITAKCMDIKKYQHRFGSASAFNNARRAMTSEEVTLNKLKQYSNIFDMKVTMIIEDKHPDVPNPIGKQIVVDITGGE